MMFQSELDMLGFGSLPDLLNEDLLLQDGAEDALNTALLPDLGDDGLQQQQQLLLLPVAAEDDDCGKATSGQGLMMEKVTELENILKMSDANGKMMEMEGLVKQELAPPSPPAPTVSMDTFHLVPSSPPVQSPAHSLVLSPAHPQHPGSPASPGSVDSGAGYTDTTEDTQSLIDEIGEFLSCSPLAAATPENAANLGQMAMEVVAAVEPDLATQQESTRLPVSFAPLASSSANTSLSAIHDVSAKSAIAGLSSDLDESAEAERILDALVKGNISAADGSGVIDVAGGDNGYLSNISNISEVVTDDGQKVVIVIARDTGDAAETIVQQLQQQQQPAQLQLQQPSPAPSTAASDSDPDYSPYSPVVSQRKRKAPAPAPSETEEEETPGGKRKVGYKRGPYKRSTHSNIVDRKERKKRQNVEAARRYRDKKKSEQSSVDMDEQTALAKNQDLKKRLSDTEGELKTLKKLMAELGLIKINE